MDFQLKANGRSTLDCLSSGIGFGLVVGRGVALGAALGVTGSCAGLASRSFDLCLTCAAC